MAQLLPMGLQVLSSSSSSLDDSGAAPAPPSLPRPLLSQTSTKKGPVLGSFIVEIPIPKSVTFFLALDPSPNLPSKTHPVGSPLKVRRVTCLS